MTVSNTFIHFRLLKDSFDEYKDRLTSINYTSGMHFTTISAEGDVIGKVIDLFYAYLSKNYEDFKVYATSLIPDEKYGQMLCITFSVSTRDWYEINGKKIAPIE